MAKGMTKKKSANHTKQAALIERVGRQRTWGRRWVDVERDGELGRLPGVCRVRIAKEALRDTLQASKQWVVRESRHEEEEEGEEVKVPRHHQRGPSY
jgi:hypothetical protein